MVERKKESEHVPTFTTYTLNYLQDLKQVENNTWKWVGRALCFPSDKCSTTKLLHFMPRPIHLKRRKWTEKY
uniref:Ovule protein n=1 Tax=Romanomermis culicivorax TaxID=13658 RepID=A0A915IEL3_ROMCU